MQLIHERCAGLDVHKKSVYACVRKLEGQRLEGQKPVIEKRRFGTMTADLLELAGWLTSHQVTHVVMESTGVYWRPVYHILEGSFEVLLTNAQHVKQVSGRKSDASDSEWLAELLQYGLLRASFIPPPPVRELRELTRTRLTLVQEKTDHANRIEKVLETANIKLGSVASEVLGVSGRRMLKAMCEGRTQPQELAELARGVLRKKLPELERALDGRMTDHHRYLLRVHLEMVTYLEDKIEELEARIERIVHQKQKEEQEQDQKQEGRQSSPFLAAITLLKTVPGIADCAARTIIGEIGIDMTRFPSQQHLASWGGLAPGMNTSGERRKQARTKKGNTVLKSTLVQCAWAAVKRKGSYLHGLFCRIVKRAGKQKAIVAVAHSLLVSIYNMLTTGEIYREPDVRNLEEQDRERLKRSLIRRLESMGYRVDVAKAS